MVGFNAYLCGVETGLGFEKHACAETFLPLMDERHGTWTMPQWLAEYGVALGRPSVEKGWHLLKMNLY